MKEMSSEMEIVFGLFVDFFLNKIFINFFLFFLFIYIYIYKSSQKNYFLQRFDKIEKFIKMLVYNFLLWIKYKW